MKFRRHYDKSKGVTTTVEIEMTPPENNAYLSFFIMLGFNKIWFPEKELKELTLESLKEQFEEYIAAKTDFSLTDPVWSLLKSTGVTQEDADAAAENFSRGYAFVNQSQFNVHGTRLACDYKYQYFNFIVEPALLIGLLARVRHGIYHFGLTPDYSIRHLMANEVYLYDNQLQGRLLAPNYNWMHRFEEKEDWKK